MRRLFGGDINVVTANGQDVHDLGSQQAHGDEILCAAERPTVETKGLSSAGQWVGSVGSGPTVTAVWLCRRQTWSVVDLAQARMEYVWTHLSEQEQEPRKNARADECTVKRADGDNVSFCRLKRAPFPM